MLDLDGGDADGDESYTLLSIRYRMDNMGSIPQMSSRILMTFLLSLFIGEEMEAQGSYILSIL